MDDFNVFLDKAYAVMADANSTKVGGNVGNLDGKTVVVPDNVKAYDHPRFNRESFLNAVAEKFGKDVADSVRALVERSDGTEPKPLSARTIIAVDKYIRGSTETMVRLSEILNRAATADVASVTANEVDKAISNLDLSQEERDALGSLRSDAEAKFREVLSKTGVEVALVTKSGSDSNPDFVRSAIKAQFDLADTLADIALGLSSGYEEIEALRDKALARATELNCLAAELVRIADSMENGEVVDEKSAKMLEETAAKLLPEKALAMHGNADAVAAVEEKLAPLMRRVEAIKAGAAENSGANFLDAKAVLSEIGLAKDALAKAAKDGFTYEEVVGGAKTTSVWHPNAAFLDAVAKMLDDTAADLQAVTDDFARNALELVAKEYTADYTNLKLFDNDTMSEAVKDFFEGYDGLEDMKTLSKLYASVHEAAKKLAVEQTRDSYLLLKGEVEKVREFKSAKRNEILTYRGLMENLNIVFKNSELHSDNPRKLARIRDIEDSLRFMDYDARETIKAIAEEFLPAKAANMLDSGVFFLSKMLHRCGFIADACNKKAFADSFRSDKILKMAIEGDLPVATVVGAMAWGATDDMLDMDICQKNCVRMKKFGSGVANDVWDVKFRTAGGGEKRYVYKSERSGEFAMQHMQAMQEGYGKQESIVHLNAASRKVASLLGTPDIVVETKVGSLKEAGFGLFMEVAPGVSFSTMRRDLRAGRKTDFGPASRQVVQNLDKADFRKLSGNFMRAAADLEWNDWLTGQSDRHSGNYLMSVGKDQSVSLKGIDNDMSFPTFRLGMTKFRAEGGFLRDLMSELERAGYLEDSSYEELRSVYGNHKAFQFSDDGKSVVIDVSKANEIFPMLRDTFGFQSIAKPVAISRGMYEKLEHLANNPQELRDAMSPHVSKAAIDAMMSRLEEMVEHARQLKTDDCVLEDEDWQSEIWQNYVEGLESTPSFTDPSGKTRKAQPYDKGLFVRDFEGFYGRRLVELR